MTDAKTISLGVKQHSTIYLIFLCSLAKRSADFNVKWKKAFLNKTMMESWELAHLGFLSPSLHRWICVMGHRYEHENLFKINLYPSICIEMCFVSYSATGRIDCGPASVAALRLGADDDSLSPLRPWLIHTTRTAPITVTLSPPCLYTSPV